MADKGTVTHLNQRKPNLKLQSTVSQPEAKKIHNTELQDGYWQKTSYGSKCQSKGG